MTPEQLWGAWNLDPVVATVVFAWLWYRRGRTNPSGRPVDRRRAWAFIVALVALVVALVSPLDALAHLLLSAHMVQHILLLLVAAPLIAWSAPSGALLRGAPPRVRRTALWLRRHVRSPIRCLASLVGPVAVWLLHVITTWVWHSAAAYEAALDNPWLHVAEHATFLGTGILFWRVVVGARDSRSRVPPGLGVLLLFGMAMQGVFLSVLLTFSTSPWYPTYATTTPWGLDPVADQHLAGLLMWIPGSVLYLAVALGLLVGWLRSFEAPATDTATRLSRHHRG